ncbi:MAG TPA: hypothetical protein VGF13_02880, partial [Verrucomicrobiae bacterium]
MGFTASGAETNPPIRATASLTNFTPNLPVIFLQTTQQIVSEPKVPCLVRMVLPNDTSSVSTGALPGLVRIHGA